MNYYNDTYISYLKHQAINHPALLHTEDSRVFEMINIEEALGDFRSSVQEKGFIMRGIWYTYSFKHTHESYKEKQGGFIIAKYHSNRRGGKESFYRAMRDSEKVVDELIAKMVQDSRNAHPLFYHSLNDPTSFFVQPKFYAGDVGYSGYLVTFRFSSFFNNCLVPEGHWETKHEGDWKTADGESWTFANPVTWMDNGLTPHEL